ncbi:hypothetical protein [Pseudonocardia sp.]|uniref:hypothetical protein n=1 Tax=Pseudonocardia sp. TaxID=60912 RepID=UPI003D102104
MPIAAGTPRRCRARLRDRQRVLHLVAGIAVLIAIYAGPLLGPGFVAIVQWVAIPVVVASGLALWKWPRIRVVLRARSRR